MTDADPDLSRRRACRSDAGAVAAYILLLLAAMMALLGLAFDGGMALSAHQAAFTEAEQAARAGAAALGAGDLRGGVVQPAVEAAISAAEHFMAASGHPGVATVVGDEVVATVLPYRVSTPLLGLAGVSSLTVSASAAATAVAG